jgi:hypothetical protein
MGDNRLGGAITAVGLFERESQIDDHMVQSPSPKQSSHLGYRFPQNGPGRFRPINDGNGCKISSNLR